VVDKGRSLRYGASSTLYHHDRSCPYQVDLPNPEPWELDPLADMSKRIVFILVLATLPLYAWPAYQRLVGVGRGPAMFVADLVSGETAQNAPFFDREFISPESVDGIVHVSSICELSQGTLAAAWYGGSREGAKDVAIFMATKVSNADCWSKPRVIVDRLSASRELSRYVKKVGNPILFSGPGNRLWLVYVTIAAGGWSGSSLNVKISDDGGITWSDSRRLTLSPFFNISELVRNRPVPMDNGGFAVPIYHECMGNFPEILWLQPGASITDIRFHKGRMAGGYAYIQPAVVALGPSVADAFYRCVTPERRVGAAVSHDAGLTWSQPAPLSLPNPNSALDAVLLSGQRILMAYNDSPVNRETLSLAVSHDRGARWRRIANIENEHGGEFSYPYMIRTQDDRIHLVYTWNRKRIRHAVFNEAWVEAQMTMETP